MVVYDKREAIQKRGDKMRLGCNKEGCDDDIELYAHDNFYCAPCGIEVAKENKTYTRPIITTDEMRILTESERDFLEPDVVIVDSEMRQQKVYHLNDVGKSEIITIEDGVTTYNEPIAMVRCIHCEAYAIGVVSKLGGFIARHQHYHVWAQSDDDDEATVEW